MADQLTGEEICDRLDGPVHGWFGLSYSNYQVVPRTLAQSMPVEWQARWVACLEELRAAFEHVEHPPAYQVEAATESTYADLTATERKAAGVTREHAPEGDDGYVYYDQDGTEHDGQERVLVPAGNPIPHYDRGRTFIGPRPPAAEPESPATSQAEADDWNARHPVGTPVLFWPGVREGEGRESKTRSEAWALGCGVAVVAVEGHSGGIALDHVEPLEESR